MDVTIRDAQPSDAPSLKILRGQAIKATFQDSYDRGTVGQLVATVDQGLPGWIEDDRYLVVVAATEITPVSYAAFDREQGEILSILTSPDYRREGFATQLLDTIEAEARTLGNERILATVPDPSRPFFDATGFEAQNGTEWHEVVAIRFAKRL